MLNNARNDGTASLLLPRYVSSGLMKGHTSLEINEKMVPRGLEPRTLRLLAVRSNQLSYETLLGCWIMFIFAFAKHHCDIILRCEEIWV